MDELIAAGVAVICAIGAVILLLACAALQVTALLWNALARGAWAEIGTITSILSLILVLYIGTGLVLRKTGLI